MYIVYKLVPNEKHAGKTDKIPLSPTTGLPISIHDDGHWVDQATAAVAAKTLGVDGVAMVITRGYFFIDIDDCLEGQQWSPLALKLLSTFKHCYREISQSRRGLHIIGRGIAPPHTCRNKSLHLEFYTESRFCALTGLQADGDISYDASYLLPTFVREYFLPPAPPVAAVTPPVSDELPDEEIITRARRSQSARSAWGNGVSFEQLWAADAEALAARWPDPDHDCGYDSSAADMALAQHLCFWTHNNTAQIERIMRQSALMRDKWDTHSTYLQKHTIAEACAKQTKFYNAAKPPAVAGDNRVSAVTGSTLLSVDQQIELFNGCTYVMDDHVALVPGGYLLNAERFKVIYGGYSFVMDNANGRISRSAWEAFTETQGYRRERAITTCFRPTLVPGALIDLEGATAVNSWWPPVIVRQAGDATPFLNHVAKLIPSPLSQRQLISYFAALVQRQGIKFQWCPVIQGVEGNGKTWLTQCLAYAVGYRYTHFPKADEITGRFNDWLYGKILIAVEDISNNPAIDVIEPFKVLITGARQEIEPKGRAKVTREVCANFVINTNHQDGMLKTRNDRRFAHFFTMQQNKEDLIRDGLDAAYFQQFVGWLKNGGFAIVADYLYTYPIEDAMNPALGHIAPITDSTPAAMEASVGPAGEEIAEAVAQGLHGFRGGWVSSIAVTALLKAAHLNTRVNLCAYDRIMDALGYKPHPGLPPKGRVHNAVNNSGRPRLFIQTGHPAAGMTEAREIVLAYLAAQE